jgi:hypothetical protein
MSHKIVPWFGKTWQEIQEAGLMPQVEGHVYGLAKKKGEQAANEYMLYLKKL